MDEPLFTQVDEQDQTIQLAHMMVAESMSEFKQLIQSLPNALCSAKLRFRDPVLSDERGEDQFFFLWLSQVVYHEREGIYSGAFFQVPRGFEKYHPVGSRLGFEPEDVFDWMVNREGHVFGGYTIRVIRARLPESRRAEFDNYTGAETYEDIPFDSFLRRLTS